MSNKLRRGWRPWAYALVVIMPLALAVASFHLTTDRSASALADELEHVGISLWLVLFAAAWLRAKKFERRAQHHVFALRSRTDLLPRAPAVAAGEAALLRAQDDLATAEIMWRMLFIVFGVLHLTRHFLITP